MTTKIKKIELQYQDTISRRRVKVTLSNGHKVYIERCYESWEQYGGTIDDLRLTMPIAEKYNNWLHGWRAEL